MVFLEFIKLNKVELNHFFNNLYYFITVFRIMKDFYVTFLMYILIYILENNIKILIELNFIKSL